MRSFLVVCSSCSSGGSPPCLCLSWAQICLPPCAHLMHREQRQRALQERCPSSLLGVFWPAFVPSPAPHAHACRCFSLGAAYPAWLIAALSCTFISRATVTWPGQVGLTEDWAGLDPSRNSMSSYMKRRIETRENPAARFPADGPGFPRRSNSLLFLAVVQAGLLSLTTRRRSSTLSPKGEARGRRTGRLISFRPYLPTPSTQTVPSAGPY